MEEKKLDCSCSDKVEKAVLSCSGACDLGEITDLLARKLKNNNIRNMKCLAMVACDNKPLIENLKSSNILVIDGCPVDCAKKIMEKANQKEFRHIRLTDYGFQKGEAPANEENVSKVYNDIQYVF
ncbi:MAG: putative zinc-binding protein [Bacteroidetes bacterium]|nr:putative zinc-binding protein [Bacteroidota bacterium]